MSVEVYGESQGKFDSRTLNRETLHRWTGRIYIYIYIERERERDREREREREIERDVFKHNICRNS